MVGQRDPSMAHRETTLAACPVNAVELTLALLRVTLVSSIYIQILRKLDMVRRNATVNNKHQAIEHRAEFRQSIFPSARFPVNFCSSLFSVIFAFDTYSMLYPGPMIPNRI